MKNILILSTGGTFNKVYNRIKGQLEIDDTLGAINLLQQQWLSSFACEGIINKDSLDFTQEDRRELVNYLKQTPYSKIVVVHGTDTMHLSAFDIAREIANKTIILTGAMVPFSIDPIEATANIASAIGFAKASDKSGVYIAMNGNIEPYNKINKDRSAGYFTLS